MSLQIYGRQAASRHPNVRRSLLLEALMNVY